MVASDNRWLLSPNTLAKPHLSHIQKITRTSHEYPDQMTSLLFKFLSMCRMPVSTSQASSLPPIPLTHHTLTKTASFQFPGLLNSFPHPGLTQWDSSGMVSPVPFLDQFLSFFEPQSACLFLEKGLLWSPRISKASLLCSHILIFLITIIIIYNYGMVWWLLSPSDCKLRCQRPYKSHALGCFQAWNKPDAQQRLEWINASCKGVQLSKKCKKAAVLQLWNVCMLRPLSTWLSLKLMRSPSLKAPATPLICPWPVSVSFQS